jgi:hypothetical protein
VFGFINSLIHQKNKKNKKNTIILVTKWKLFALKRKITPEELNSGNPLLRKNR